MKNYIIIIIIIVIIVMLPKEKGLIFGAFSVLFLGI